MPTDTLILLNSRDYEVQKPSSAHSIEKYRHNTNSIDNNRNIILPCIFLRTLEKVVSKKIRYEEPRQVKILAVKKILVQYKTIGLSQGCSSTIVENKEEIMIKIHYIYGLMKKQ